MIHDASAVSLKKGTYSVDVLLRHPERSQLEAIKDVPLLLHLPIDSAVNCPVYGSRHAASSRGKGPGSDTMDEYWLRQGGHRDMYVSSPSSEKVPKWVVPGDLLTGEVMIDDLDPDCTAVPLVFEPPPHPVEKKAEDDDDTDTAKKAKETPKVEQKGEELTSESKEQNKEAVKLDAGQQCEEPTSGSEEQSEKAVKEAAEDEEELKKAILAASLERLTKLRTSKASIARYDKLSVALKKENAKHLPLLLEVLTHAKTVEAPEDGPPTSWRAVRVGAAVSAIQDAVDEDDIALYFGRAHDHADAPDKKEAKKKAKEMDEQRSALRAALLARASTLAPAEIGDINVAWEGAESEGDDGSLDGFKEAVRGMKAWVTSPDALSDEEDKDTLALVLVKYELVMGRPGSALSLLRARIGAQTPASKLGKAMREDLAVLCRNLGFQHWALNTDESVLRNYPSTQVPL